MNLLTGRTALVTGAARGIGRGIAEAFANEGAAVAVTDRDEAAAREVVEGIESRGGRAFALRLDVTDPGEAERAVRSTLEELGAIDVLVNNAGIDTTAKLIDMPLAQWQQMIDVNLTSVFVVTRAVMPGMVEQGRGRIINISSQLALKGGDTMVHYCAAKAGVLGFTRALALEGAPHGITVNAICPGPIETDLLRALPDEWLAAKKAELPLGRFGRVEEIAPTAVLLASDGGAYYTGSTLNVSGGDVMA